MDILPFAIAIIAALIILPIFLSGGPGSGGDSF